MANNPAPRNLNRTLGATAQDGQHQTNLLLEAMMQKFQKLAQQIDPAVLTDRQDALTDIGGDMDDLLATMTHTKTVSEAARKAAGGQTNVAICTEIPDFERKDPVDNTRLLYRETDLPRTRDYKIPPLTGKLDDPFETRATLYRIMQLAEQRRLNEQTSITLLLEFSTGQITLLIQKAQKAGIGLEGILREIELRFGGLKDPMEARRQLDLAQRHRGETLIALGARLDELAFMATRLEAHEPDVQQVALADRIFLNLLPGTLQREVNRVNRTRRFAGQEELKGNALYAQANALEIENHLIANRKSESLHFIGEDDSDDEYEVNRIQYGAGPRKYKQDRQKSGGQHRGFQRGGRRPQHRQPFYSEKAKQVFAISQSPSETTDHLFLLPEEEDQLYEVGITIDDGHTLCIADYDDKILRISLAKLNVKPAQCAKCGIYGHRAWTKDTPCPLKSVPIQDRPCPKCGTGGHLGAHCVNIKAKNA